MEINITIKNNPILRRVLWFVGLWCLGVLTAMLLALPFKILILAAKF